jgi:hypothetical protein
MGDVDWTVIGSKWRRWHPVNPVEMKRHGDNPKSSPPERSDGEDFDSQSRKRLTKRSVDIIASSPCFRQSVASINPHARENPNLVRPYGVALLTMIKIVLIGAISFASPSQ